MCPGATRPTSHKQTESARLKRETSKAPSNPKSPTSRVSPPLLPVSDVRHHGSSTPWHPGLRSGLRSANGRSSPTPAAAASLGGAHVASSRHRRHVRTTSLTNEAQVGAHVALPGAQPTRSHCRGRRQDSRETWPRGSNEETHSDPAASARSSSLRTRRQGSVSTAPHAV